MTTWGDQAFWLLAEADEFEPTIPPGRVTSA
jgi:hypothetical protein